MRIQTLLIIGALWLIAVPVQAQNTAFKVTSRPGQATVSDGVIYVGSQAGSLHAVDMVTGRELWSVETGGPVFHAPLVHSDIVIFGSWDGGLRAVSKAEGVLKWKFQAGEVDWDVRDIFVNGIPIVVDDVVYFSSEDFNVYAVNVETGREVWHHNLGEEPQAREIPIMDRTAYIGAWDGHVHALDIDSGELVWRSETDDADRAALPDQVPFVTVVPIVTEDAVYFSDWAGNLFAVDRASGKQIWRFDPHAADSRHVGSRSYMALYADVLYYSTLEDKHLYGVDRQTGQEVWSVETEGIAYGPRGIGDGTGFYMEFIPDAAGDGVSIWLRLMDLGSREVLWSTDEATSPPTLDNGIVYYVGADGTVHGREVISGEKTFRLGGL